MTQWIGIDVGGANLKLATTDGYACSLPFELWRRRDELPVALEQLLQQVPAGEAVAATMTGELADCYATKREGVQHITRSLVQAVGDRQLVVYGVDGQFRSPAETLANPLPAAASNWHALARFASRYLDHSTGVVIDIGSTTADIVPVESGRVATESTTDVHRLLAGELVYTGIARTPIAAIVRSLPYRGQLVPVAAEYFATTADVYQLLGVEAFVSDDSADGRDFSPLHCVDRLARQICADREVFAMDDAVAVCRQVQQVQLEMLQTALQRGVDRLGGGQVPAIVSGSGEKLGWQLAAQHPGVRDAKSLGEYLDARQSDAAAAVAVATLALEEVPR